MVSPARAAELASIFNDKAPISRTLGLKLTFDEKGDVVVTMPEFQPGLTQTNGSTHGGIQAVMLDTVMWFQAVSRHEPNYWPVTSTLSMTFTRPAGKSPLTARAKVVATNSKQDVVEGYVFDQQGRQCSHAVATFLSTATDQRPKAKL